MIRLPLIEKVKPFKIRNHRNHTSPYQLQFLIFFLIVFLVILAIRLFQLTVVKGDYYRRLSDENRIRNIVIEPQRGEIIDRKGIVVAKNIEADLNLKTQRIKSKRVYENPHALSHLIGYRQIADEKDIAQDPCLIKLKMADKTGKKGVEKVFDCELRGVTGYKLVELDALGNNPKTVAVQKPQKGNIVQLAFDYDLQKKAYDLLKGKRGAVVALNPKTAEILALVSAPTFNPQDFEDEIESEVSKYLRKYDHPLFNRATEAAYPPGSIYKVYVAAGALEDEKIDKNFKVEDTGTIKAGSLTFSNWYFLEYRKTEGVVDIVKGIRRSNDIFFYRVGEKLGPERMKFWSNKFGLGREVDFGMDNVEGLIPSPFWKKEILKENWYLGDTYNMAIGQGYLLVSPLQVALATGVFANGGNLCSPQLLKTEKGNCENLKLSKETLALVREGMKQACSVGGTGWPLFDFQVEASGSGKPKTKIQTACKTGTAESHGKDPTPHAWFTVFAPYDKPEIVVTVLVENGGQGSDVAAPIAREVLKSYFERTQ